MLADTKSSEKTYLSNKEFVQRSMHGWKVWVHRDLEESKSEQAKVAMNELNQVLLDLKKTLPKDLVEKGLKIPIWIHNKSFEGYEDDEFIEYHSNVSWLKQNHRNLSMKMSIEIQRAYKLKEYPIESRNRFARVFKRAFVYDATKKKSLLVPTSDFVEKKVEGWTVMLHKRLLNEEKDVGEKVLRELKFQLYYIAREVPKKSLKILQDVKFWVHMNRVGDARGVPAAELHWSENWLRNNGRNPDMALGVEVGDAKNFLDYARKKHYIILHELAHGFHALAMTDEENDELEALYKEARSKGKYEKVLHFGGRESDSYGSTSAEEYFAECIVAYFGHCQNYPFVEPELKIYDPKIHAFIEKVLGVAEEKEELEEEAYFK